MFPKLLHCSGDRRAGGAVNHLFGNTITMRHNQGGGEETSAGVPSACAFGDAPEHFD